MRLRHNGRHFREIFKYIFLNKNVGISIKVSMKFVPKGPINDIPALVQIMAWRRPDDNNGCCRTGDKPLYEPLLVTFNKLMIWYWSLLVKRQTKNSSFIVHMMMPLSCRTIKNNHSNQMKKIGSQTIKVLSYYSTHGIIFQHHSTLCMLCCSDEICKYIVIIISGHWDGTGSWNPSAWTTRNRLSHMINASATDDPATQVKSMLNSMLINKDLLTWLLISWRLCYQPIRCQVWNSLSTNMDLVGDFKMKNKKN